MTISIHELPRVEEQGAKVLSLALSGKLEKEDYEHLVPELEMLVDEHGKINLMVELMDFGGWSAGAAWEDTKLGIRHFSDIGKLAFVGDSRWEQGLALFSKPFTAARVKYFDVKETDEAIKWLRQA